MATAANMLIDGVSPEALPPSREEQKLFNAFIAIIVIVACPGKFLFYISPGVVILASIFVGKFVNFWRFIGVSLGVLSLSLITMAFDITDGAHVNLPGLVFGMVMYLPIFILWSLSKDFRVTESFALRLANACLVFILVEGVIGAAQWVIAHDSDLVSGTYGLFDIANNERTISQVNFCFTLFCMTVYCAMWIEKRRMKLACGVALATALVAEAAHQTLFFIGLMPALAVTGGRRFRRLATSIAFVLALLAGTTYVDPEIFEHIDGWADKVFLLPTSPKRLSVTGAFELMQDKNLLLGVGLGQFSSRGAILSSGIGSSLNLPEILVDTSTYYEQFMKSPVNAYRKNGESSAISMPYFSAMSVITEFGLLFSVILLLKMLRAILENIRLGAASQAAWRASCYCNFLIGFLFLCSFIQNYLELTQAIMIPILLYIVSKARLRALAEVAVPLQA